MKITPLDGLDRYHVQSETNPDIQFLIDLKENKGNGFCSCPQFHYRIQNLLDAGFVAPKEDPDMYRCKHIVGVRESLGKELVDEVTKPK